MSSRIHSEFGTLGQRLAGHQGPKPCPQHVWLVAEDRPRTPALLLAWTHDDEGWFGNVVWAEDTGHIHFEVLPAAALRPART